MIAELVLLLPCEHGAVKSLCSVYFETETLCQCTTNLDHQQTDQPEA